MADIGKILRKILATLGFGRGRKAAPKTGAAEAPKPAAKAETQRAPAFAPRAEAATKPEIAKAGTLPKSAAAPKPAEAAKPLVEKPKPAAAPKPAATPKPKAVEKAAKPAKRLPGILRKPVAIARPEPKPAKKVKKKIAIAKMPATLSKAQSAHLNLNGSSRGKKPAVPDFGAAVKKMRKKPKGKAVKKKISAPEKKDHKKAALKGWATRRKRLFEKLRKLEKTAKRTASVETQMGKLRSQLLEARRHEVELMESKAGEGEAAKASEVEDLKETVRRIEREAGEQAAKAAVNVPAYVYVGAPQEMKLGIDEEIAIVKRMMKALEIEFYKRRINEDEFRKRTFEYQQELNELEERKKAIEEARKTQIAQPRETGAAVGAMVAPPGIGRAAPEVRLPVRAPEPRVAPSAASAGPGLAEIQLKTIEELRKLAEAMKEEARQRVYAASIPAVQAEAAPPEDIEERIMEVRSKSKALEMEFYKRRISAEEFRKRMFEYQQEMRELEARRKAAAEAAAKGTGQKPWGEAPVAAAENMRAAPATYRGAQPRAQSAPAMRAFPTRPAEPAAKTEFGRIVEKKAISGIDKEELRRLEGKMDEVITRYGIPRKEVEQKVRELSSEKILDNFSRLIDIIEAQKKDDTAAGPKIKAAPVETIAPGEMLRLKATAEIVATGISKSRIVTDFDRVLAKVSEGGEISAGKLGKELNLGKKQLDEVLDVLEERKLVVRRYPAFGEPAVSLAGYVRPKKAKSKNVKNKQEV